MNKDMRGIITFTPRQVFQFRPGRDGFFIFDFPEPVRRTALRLRQPRTRGQLASPRQNPALPDILNQYTGLPGQPLIRYNHRVDRIFVRGKTRL